MTERDKKPRVAMALLSVVFLLLAAAPASAQIYEDFSISPSGFGYPSFIRHCEQLIIDVTADNDGDQTVVYSVSVEEDPSPYSGWLDAAGFSGYFEPYTNVTGQVTLNDGNTICEEGTVVKVTGRVVFDLSSMGADTFHIELIVADTVAMPVWDTISTNCTQLVVSSHGSAGLGGIGGVNLDYAGDDPDNGEWRADANVYLFDASTVIGFVSDADTVMNWTSSGTTIADPHSLIPIHDTTALGRVRTHFSEPWADGFYTGLYTNNDSTIALETFWYANTDPGYSCGFVIKETKVYSLDGVAHDSIIVGEIVDWNIPADSNSADNSSGIVPLPWYGGILYQQGTEYSGFNDAEEDANGGWDETERYGAMRFLLGYEYDVSGSQTAINTYSYGLYTAANSECTPPCEFGYDPDSLFANHAEPDTSVSDSVDTDLHMGMTYLFKHDLGAGDTLYLYTAYLTTMSDFFPTASRGPGLANIAEDTWEFLHVYLMHEDPSCTYPGDANHDGSVDISDLTYYVDYMFGGGPRPIFPAEFDVDNNCSLDISDLTYYVDFMFSGGSPPMPCHNCPNLY